MTQVFVVRGLGEGAGCGELGGAIQDRPSHADQTDWGSETAEEIQETESRQWEDGDRFFPFPTLFSATFTCLLMLCLVLPVQVLSLRKGGVFPGQQFSLDGDDEDEDGDDSSVLERKVRGASMPDAALKVCLKELKRLVWTRSVL